jgi:hypothetical protein
MNSEVAQLKERLRLEAEAMYQGLHGYAQVAKHEIMKQKHQTIQELTEQLKTLVGTDAAYLYTMTTLDNAQEGS